MILGGGIFYLKLVGFSAMDVGFSAKMFWQHWQASFSCLHLWLYGLIVEAEVSNHQNGELLVAYNTLNE